ncbi:MAG: Sua5/YciO/YrdC/YwlC family protein [Ghiorsea sp.]|nr:Sua5/YciO/YrdC/YwlC family protein [Ghiorsea sp.]
MMTYQTRLAAKALRQGGLIAHQTSTLAGIAADVRCNKGVRKAQSFKQRQAPFLLLASSVGLALKQAVYITPTLRKLAKDVWPGAVTLVFKANKHLNPACYQSGYIAVRVDSDKQTRQLAKACGGLLLSSSFNRKAKATIFLHCQQRYRLKRHLSCVLSHHHQGSSQASKIFKITGHRVQQLR